MLTMPWFGKESFLDGSRKPFSNVLIKSFGKNPTGDRLKRIQCSPNFEEGKFRNVEPTTVMRKGVSPLTLLKAFFNKPNSVIPSGEIPHVKTNLHELRCGKPTVVWFGHSSYLIHSKGVNILVDPVFSGHASPFGSFIKAFPGSNSYQADDFPEIDILLLTHDHYDHLDLETIQKIHPRAKKIITSLGVGSHLEYWGVDKNKITELDWWQEQNIDTTISFTAAPARHFSGRGLVRNKTFWSSFILKLHGLHIFLGGDSGYDVQFKNIGERFGGFDLAFLECGQYNLNWPQIHMFPEETVQAAIDLKAKIFLPVHWSKFPLSTHPWNEPPKRMIRAAKKNHQEYVIPLIGEPYTIGEPYQQMIWWDFHE